MRHSIASAIALIALSPIAAAEPPRDDACTVLSPQAQAVQLGSRASSRYLLIEDGDTHYRLDLFRNASYAPLATPIRLVSNGQARPASRIARAFSTQSAMPSRPVRRQ